MDTLQDDMNDPTNPPPIVNQKQIKNFIYFAEWVEENYFRHTSGNWYEVKNAKSPITNSMLLSTYDLYTIFFNLK